MTFIMVIDEMLKIKSIKLKNPQAIQIMPTVSPNQCLAITEYNLERTYSRKITSAPKLFL